MARLAQLWGWVKLNAVMLAIFAAVLSFCTVVSYFKGRDHGADACEARYEKQKSENFQAVIAELQTMDARDAQLRAEYEKQKQLIEQALARKETHTYEVVEKIIEKPVQVGADCRIDYTIVELLNDAATANGN